MILTVTLNAALDVTYTMASVTGGGSNRVGTLRPEIMIDTLQGPSDKTTASTRTKPHVRTPRPPVGASCPS